MIIIERNSKWETTEGGGRGTSWPLALSPIHTVLSAFYLFSFLFNYSEVN